MPKAYVFTAHGGPEVEAFADLPWPVVNVLAAPQRHLSANFARRGAGAAWDGVRHRFGPTGSPRLDGVLAALECTVKDSFPGGDHEIIVGRVHDVETSGNDAAPLLYWCGGYSSLGQA